MKKRPGNADLKAPSFQSLSIGLASIIHHLVIVIDGQERITFVDPGRSNVLNLSPEDILGEPIGQLLGGRLFNATLRQSIDSLKVQGDSFKELPIRLESKATGRKAFLVDGCRMPNESGEAMTILSFREIALDQLSPSATRLTQRHYRHLMEQVADYAIFMTDTDGLATSWNEGVQRLLGYTEDEFIGNDVVPLIFTPEAIQGGVAKWEFDTAANEGAASDDRWMIRKGGEQFWASGITTSLHDDDGKLIGFNKVMRDLTDRKKAEDKLRDLAAELSEADRRKNEFLATLAHELRNPLSPIKAAAQLMQLVDDDPVEFRRLSEVIDRQANQMVRLIDDLMDVSRISRGKIALKKIACDLNEIVSTAIEATKPFIEKSGQTLCVEVCDEALVLLADADRLSQSLTNLLNNAAKYTPASGEIWLSVKREAGEAVISIRDNGIGLLEGQLATIFEMFQQVDVSKERGQSGLGIGLSLVKSLIELHNGSVVAKSEGRNRGSEFIVRLPLVSGNVSTTGHIVQPKREVKASRSFRVLVVEDTRAIRVMLAKLLTKLGHVVEQAGDGREAFDKAMQTKPDVIFSDISMPEMNGHELAKKIRGTAALCDVPMVALTGFGQEADRENAIESGFNHHMVKPPDVAVLADYFIDLEAGCSGPGHDSDSNSG